MSGTKGVKAAVIAGMTLCQLLMDGSLQLATEACLVVGGALLQAV